MQYNDFLSLVKARRSIRQFKEDPVPDESVEKIIEAIRFAPSSANSQPWVFIVIKGSELKEKIVELLKSNWMILNKLEMSREKSLRVPEKKFPGGEPGFKFAPVYILICGDKRTRQAFPVITQQTRADSHFISNLANAYMYLDLAAYTLGLGSQRVSAVESPFVKPFLRELLEIPEELYIYHMAAIGYPNEKPDERQVRSLQEMVHFEKYDRRKFRTDAEVREYIRENRTRHKMKRDA